MAEGNSNVRRAWPGDVDGMTTFCLITLTAWVASSADNASYPGEVTVPYPTVSNLSLEWAIDGDANLNSRVAVEYRPIGDEQWHEALPLQRVPAGIMRHNTGGTFRWKNKHSGSVFDLRPNTRYEVRLTLADPDGGSADRTVLAKTRRIPKAAAGARVIPTTSVSLKAKMASAVPGDILQLSPGYYGSFVASADGEPDRPIVIRGDSRHAIPSTFDSISLQNSEHLILERVQVNGSVDLLGANDVAVRYCSINAKFGIIANRPPGCTSCYIADNVVTYVMPWVAEGIGSESMWGGPANVGEGIQLTGPGNMICFNRVKGYRDCISLMEDGSAHEQVSIDIYNNDLDVGVDDAIEADFCMGNCRVYCNRITNCCIGLSSQPSLGGPTYFFRNVMYNLALAPFKLERHSVGNLFFHNTAVKTGDGLFMHHGPGEYSRTLLRNNLCIGGGAGGKYGQYTCGTGRAINIAETDPTNDFDYDAIGSQDIPFSGRVGNVEVSTIEELSRRTTEKHAVLVDISVFDNVEFPQSPFPARQAPDLRPRAGCAVIDVGARIPSINDRYSGAAPDLGAYECGRPLPHYGPRREGVNE